jgi:hypothetical protein
MFSVGCEMSMPKLDSSVSQSGGSDEVEHMQVQRNFIDEVIGVPAGESGSDDNEPSSMIVVVLLRTRSPPAMEAISAVDVTKNCVLITLVTLRDELTS